MSPAPRSGSPVVLVVAAERLSLLHQVAIRDAAAVCEVALSNALQGEVP